MAAPSPVRNDTASTNEDNGVSINVLANDPGAPKQIYSLNQTSPSSPTPADTPVTLGSGATISIVGGQVVYDPGSGFQWLAAGQTATDSFTYSIRQKNGTISTATVMVTVNGANDAPVVTGAVTGAAIEDGDPATLSALANASDVDRGAVLSVVNVPTELPAGVSYSAATKSFTLDPSHAAYQGLGAGQTTSITVGYGVSDGSATTAASVSWTLSGRDEPPPSTAPQFTRTDYDSIGEGPRAVAVGDFNGDGHLDFVTIGWGNGIWMYSGSGDGAFQRASDFVDLGGGHRIYTSDLNGDGILDLIVAGDVGYAEEASGDPTSDGGHTIRVALGVGDGTFTPANGYATDSVSHLAIGDVNHDGIPDVLAGTMSELVVLLGTGDGSFRAAPPIDVDIGVDDGPVVLTDLNGDGYLNIVSFDRSTNRVRVLEDDTNGVFVPVSSYELPVPPGQIRAADLDGDSYLDLVIAEDDHVLTMLGNGDGTFQAAVRHSTGSAPLDWRGAAQRDLAVADVDGDGHLDILTTNYADGTVSLLLGRGDGSFVNRVDYAVGDGPMAIAVEDFNGDGRADLVVTNLLSGVVSVMLQTGDLV